MLFGVEDERHARLCVILRGQIAFVFRAIGTPTLARIINPAHDVLEIIFLADALKISSEVAAHTRVAFAN